MKYILHILFLILTTALLAQAPSKFYTRIGGNGYDYGYDIKQTLDKGYIFTGSTTSFGQTFPDLYLTKLDSMGQVKFQKYIGNASNEIGKSVIQLSDSSFVIAGYTNSIGFGGYDVYLVKTDKAGNMMWAKTYGGQDWDFAYSLQQTQDGGFVIGGTTYSMGRGGADGYIIKTDANGVEQWHKTYGGINDDEFKSVIQTNDGNYALTGYTKSYNDIDSGDVWIFKLDTNGDSLWCKFYGGNKEDFGNQLFEMPSNNELYIAGATASFGAGKLDAYVFRTDNNGNFINYGTDGSSANDEEFTSIILTNRTPNTIALNEKELFPAYGLQAKIMELTSVLLYINATEYGSTIDDEIFKIIPTSDKGIAGIGYTNGYGAILSDVYFLKIDSSLYGSTSIVSVKENSFNNISFKIYPNPTINNYIYITSDNTLKDVKISIYNIIGEEVSIKEIISQDDKLIRICFFENQTGIYFLKIGHSLEKIIISTPK